MVRALVRLLPLVALALVASACSDSDEGEASADTVVPPVTALDVSTIEFTAVELPEGTGPDGFLLDDPDGSIQYVAWDGTAARSADGGLSWEAIAPIGDPGRLVATRFAGDPTRITDATDASVGISISELSLVRSFDGFSWNRIDEPVLSRMVFAETAGDGAVVAAVGLDLTSIPDQTSTHGDFTLIRSTDGFVLLLTATGQSWAVITADDVAALEVLGEGETDRWALRGNLLAVIDPNSGETLEVIDLEALPARPEGEFFPTVVVSADSGLTWARFAFEEAISVQASDAALDIAVGGGNLVVAADSLRADLVGIDDDTPVVDARDGGIARVWVAPLP